MSPPEGDPSDASDAQSIPSAPIPPARTIKRKFDDAFQSLDDVLGSFEQAERPIKRVQITRSIYSTLAKYGIKTRGTKSNSLSAGNDALSKKTPHLTAIIARAASRTRKAIPLKLSPSTPPNLLPPNPPSEYRPSSIPSFLSRLATFKLATYSNKPPEIDAVAASKCGWINHGKDRLVCGICNASWVVAGREGMTREAANALIEKQKNSLIEMHKKGCPWKTRQCDSSIYRIPLQSPAVMAKEIKLNAAILESVLKGIKIKHPLASMQVQAFCSALPSFASLDVESTNFESPRESSSSIQAPQSEPSETSILTSLFGWVLSPTISEPKAPTRPNSPLLPSSALCPTSPNSRSVTPTPGHPRPLLRVAVRRDSPLLHCTLCNRRVGLWAFIPQANGVLSSTAERPAFLSVDVAARRNSSQLQPSQRLFDVLKEHRSYCPYVVRSTTVPTLPVPRPNNTNGRTPTMFPLNGQSGEVEGWRAVLTIILRYGIGRQQRMGLRGVSESEGDETNSQLCKEPIDDIRAMVAGVKSQGGKDLLNTWYKRRIVRSWFPRMDM